MVEADRRRVLEYLAMSLTEAGPYNRDPPKLDLSGVKLHNGRVRVSCDGLPSQEAVVSALRGIEGFTVSTVQPPRRYILGLPGYMVAIGGARAIALLERQNPDLPRGGMTLVSLHRGSGANPHPIMFVDLSEEAERYVLSHGSRLDTLPKPIGVRPASPKDSSQ